MGSASIERSERLAPEPALALSRLIDVPSPGDTLPLLWHWMHFLDRPAEADLGSDGHPMRGGVLDPPAPGLRRMWAAGRVKTHRPLHYEDIASRRTEVSAGVQKSGRSGPLTFVTVRHEIHASGQLAVEEEQAIVYRQPARPTEPPTSDIEPAPPPTDGGWHVNTTPTLLFRFSALTYNAHRIHYDRDYARDVEGYPRFGRPRSAASVADGRSRACDSSKRARSCVRLSVGLPGL